MADDPILDLSTTTPRPKVRIDGELYELRGQSDLSLRDYQTLQQIMPRLGALLLKTDSSAELTQADGDELDELLQRGCAMAFLGAATVLKRVQQVDRILLFRAFFEPLAPRLQRLLGGSRAETSPSSGPTPSRGSNASTATRSKAGARSR